MNTKPIKMRSRGYYSLSKRDAEGNPRTEGCPQNVIGNIITYTGAEHSLLVDSLDASLYAAVGTSVVERTRDSTSLGSEVSGRTGGESASRAGNEVDNLDGTSTVTLTRELFFTLGSKVGTFSEVGLYSSSAGGVFIAGQLIKDEFDNPTTVTVLVDEQLVITYTLEWTVPNNSLEVGSGSVTDADSNSYDYEIWAQPYFADYNGTSGTSRYFNTSSSNGISARTATGTTPRTPNLRQGTPWSVSLGTGGTVTANFSSETYGPSYFSLEDIVFLGIGIDGYYSSSSQGDISDTATALAASSIQNKAACVIKFLTPFSKTSDNSFSIDVEMVVEV